jgi:hypothetical protein
MTMKLEAEIHLSSRFGLEKERRMWVPHII